MKNKNKKYENVTPVPLKRGWALKARMQIVEFTTQYARHELFIKNKGWDVTLKEWKNKLQKMGNAYKDRAINDIKNKSLYDKYLIFLYELDEMHEACEEETIRDNLKGLDEYDELFEDC